MLRVGIAGFGFMGRMHYRCWNEQPGTQVVAVCDQCLDALAGAKAGLGNLPGAAETIDLSSLQTFSDLPTTLAKADLDAISITLPTHLHAETTLRALEAGLHVLCEKPMALSVAECDRMIAAARASGRLLQIGHCIRFWPEYAEGRAIVASGRYGRLIAASFQRFSATASKLPTAWFMDQCLSGGMPLDLHIHDSDYVQHLLGMPEAVTSRGAAGEAGQCDHIVTHYDYGNGCVVSAEGGWRMAPAYGFSMRYHLVLERATIVFDSSQSPTLRVYPSEGEAYSPALDPADGYARQIDHFARRLAGEAVSPVITPEEARDSVRLVEAELESARTGRRVALV